MPIIRLQGVVTDEYSIGTLQLCDEGQDGEVLQIKLKIRGGTSRKYQKKSLAIKVIDENGEKRNVSLLCMRSDNKWILDAMAIDKARMRNRVAFDIWNEYSTPCYIANEYGKQMQNGINGHFVELYLNDKYWGIYCLNEKIDRKQLGLRKYVEKARGLLFKAVSWKGTQYWDLIEQYDNNSPILMGWECKYPDVEDDGPTDWSPLANNINFVLTADSETFCNEVAARFDLPVMIDYIVFSQFIEAQDNAGKNTFAYFYDIDQTLCQGFAPWDLDATFGRGYDGSALSANLTIPYNHLFERLINEMPGFERAVRQRYAELRLTAFDATALEQRFAIYFSLFSSSGASQRETDKWSDVDGIKLDFQHEQQYINQWIKTRLSFADKFFGFESNPVTTIYATNAPNCIYNLKGQCVAPNRTNKGIYIVKGRKMAL